MLDQDIVLAVGNGKLGDATLGVEDPELGMLIPDDRGAVRSTLEPDARPSRQFIGDFVDERRGIAHKPIVYRLRPAAIVNDAAVIADEPRVDSPRLGVACRWASVGACRLPG
jgi:hypothetical protein